VIRQPTAINNITYQEKDSQPSTHPTAFE